MDTTLPSGTLVSWDTGTPGPRAICADCVSTCEAMAAGPDVARASRGRFIGDGRETGVSVMSTLLRCWDLCFSSLARRRCSSHCCSRAAGNTSITMEQGDGDGQCLCRARGTHTPSLGRPQPTATQMTTGPPAKSKVSSNGPLSGSQDDPGPVLKGRSAMGWTFPLVLMCSSQFHMESCSGGQSSQVISLFPHTCGHT